MSMMRSAIHEAGHLVAAAGAVEFHTLEVTENGGAARAYTDKMAVDDDGTRAAIRTSLGGIAALHVSGDEPALDGADSDLRKAKGLARRLDPADPDRIMDEEARAALAICEREWPTLGRLAATLAAYTRLDRNEIRIALRCAQNAWPTPDLTVGGAFARRERMDRALADLESRLDDEPLTKAERPFAAQAAEDFALGGPDPYREMTVYRVGRAMAPPPPPMFPPPLNRYPIWGDFNDVVDQIYAERAVRHEAIRAWVAAQPAPVARHNHPAPRGRAVRTMTPTRGLAR